jgi:hypothetical protein
MLQNGRRDPSVPIHAVQSSRFRIPPSFRTSTRRQETPRRAWVSKRCAGRHMGQGGGTQRQIRFLATAFTFFGTCRTLRRGGSATASPRSDLPRPRARAPFAPVAAPRTRGPQGNPPARRIERGGTACASAASGVERAQATNERLSHGQRIRARLLGEHLVNELDAFPVTPWRFVGPATTLRRAVQTLRRLRNVPTGSSARAGVESRSSCVVSRAAAERGPGTAPAQYRNASALLPPDWGGALRTDTHDTPI